jgi:hypothetical protein
MSFWQSLKPDPKNLRSDVVSGFAMGLFSIPEGMAYAQLAGVNPVYGLYSGGKKINRRYPNKRKANMPIGRRDDR